MHDVDTGSSIIEAVVGISLLGLVLVGVVDTSASITRAAASSRDRATANLALTDSLRTLRSVEYSPCPQIDHTYADVLRSAHDSEESGMSIDIARYEYWNDATATWIDFSGFGASTCATNTELNHPFAAQRITVALTDVNGSEVSTTFVKSRVPYK